MLKGNSKASQVSGKAVAYLRPCTTVLRKIDVFGELLEHQINGPFLLQSAEIALICKRCTECLIPNLLSLSCAKQETNCTVLKLVINEFTLFTFCALKQLSLYSVEQYTSA